MEIKLNEIKTVEDLVICNNIPDCIKVDILHRIVNSLVLDDGSNIINNNIYKKQIKYANDVLQNELSK